MAGTNKKNNPVVHSSAPPGTQPVAPGVPGWALPAVLLFTALLYARATLNGLTNFDDYNYIIENPFIRALEWDNIKAIFTSFYESNYHPLTTLTFLFEYTNSGADPLSYHLINVVLHVANTWLVYKVADRLSGKPVTALVACILFAIHPMHVESVAWASERKDVLYSFFYLSAILSYLRYRTPAGQTKHYIITIVLFLLSLLSKSAAVTLPVLLIAIDIYQGRKLDRKAILEKIPLLALSLVFGIVNLMAQQGAMTNLNSSYSALNRLFLFTYSIVFYIVKLFVPLSLSALHFFPGETNGALPWEYYLSLPLLALAAWLVFRRSAYRRLLIFGSSSFLITISVMLQLIPVGSAVASERYTYIPYIGLFFIAGELVSANIEKYKRSLPAILGCIALLLSALTWARIGVWKNDETLFGEIINKDPKHAIAIGNGFFERGKQKLITGDLEGARIDFTQAGLFSPKYADAFYNRGIIYASRNEVRAAISDFTRVIEINPALAVVYNKRATLLTLAGQADSAIADFTKAIALDPANAAAYHQRGWALYNTGKKAAALADYNHALSIDSTIADAYNNRGWYYFESGNNSAAIADYSRAVFYDPKNTTAYGNLAAIKSNTGDLTGAVAAYDSLIRLLPRDRQSYRTRADVKYRLKDSAGACADWQMAARLGDKDAAVILQEHCR